MKVKSKLKGHSKRITGLAFSHVLNVLVSSGADSQVSKHKKGHVKRIIENFQLNLIRDLLIFFFGENIFVSAMCMEFRWLGKTKSKILATPAR